MYMYMHNDYLTTEEIKTRYNICLKMGATKERKLSYKKETKFKAV